MKEYLGELALLIGRPVSVGDLVSLDETEKMRSAAMKFQGQPSRIEEVLFSDRCSERFDGFIKRLRVANPSPIYIWTSRTADCGALKIPSLDLIKFDFDFSINNEGLLAFSDENMEDRLLLDFSYSNAGEKIMKIETQGVNWVSVIY